MSYGRHRAPRSRRTPRNYAAEGRFRPLACIFFTHKSARFFSLDNRVRRGQAVQVTGKAALGGGPNGFELSANASRPRPCRGGRGRLFGGAVSQPDHHPNPPRHVGADAPGGQRRPRPFSPALLCRDARLARGGGDVRLSRHQYARHLRHRATNNSQDSDQGVDFQ